MNKVAKSLYASLFARQSGEVVKQCLIFAPINPALSQLTSGFLNLGFNPPTVRANHHLGWQRANEKTRNMGIDRNSIGEVLQCYYMFLQVVGLITYQSCLSCRSNPDSTLKLMNLFTSCIGDCWQEAGLVGRIQLDQAFHCCRLPSQYLTGVRGDVSGSPQHEEVATACPILCFINPKSGSQYGVKLLEQLDKVLGAQQVGLTCCGIVLQVHTDRRHHVLTCVAARQVPGVQQVLLLRDSFPTPRAN